MKRIIHIFVFVLCIIIVLGCFKENNSSNTTSSNGKYTKIDLQLPSMSSCTAIRNDEKISLGICGYKNEDFEWHSDNPNITVNNGVCEFTTYSGVSFSIDELSSVLAPLYSKITAKNKYSNYEVSFGVIFKEPSDYEIRICSSFINLDGHANQNIDDTMVYKGNGEWEKIIEVTNEEKDFVPKWIKDYIPSNVDANGIIYFSDKYYWGKKSEIYVLYQANMEDTLVKNNGEEKAVMAINAIINSNITDIDERRILVKIEKGKKYRLTLNTKRLKVKFEEIN